MPNKEEDRVYSWETWRCTGRNKDGSRCKNPIRRGHIKESGEIFVPLTCSKHITQEEELRRELGKKMIKEELTEEKINELKPMEKRVIERITEPERWEE